MPPAGIVTVLGGKIVWRSAARPSWPPLALVAETRGYPSRVQARLPVLVKSSGHAVVPAATLPALRLTQTDRSAVEQARAAEAGTEAGAAEAADVARTAPPRTRVSAVAVAMIVRRMFMNIRPPAGLNGRRKSMRKRERHGRPAVELTPPGGRYGGTARYSAVPLDIWPYR